jgi:hypothetical protein
MGPLPICEDGHCVKVIVNAVLLVPSDKLDEDTAAAISAVSQSSTGALAQQAGGPCGPG